MTASVVQEGSTLNLASGTSLVFMFTNNTGNGNAIHLLAAWDDGNSTPPTISDNYSNSYGTNLNLAHDTHNTEFYAHWVAQNISGGAGHQITVTWNTGTLSRLMAVSEVGGVTASPVDGHNGQYQASPGIGTDSVTSLTATNLNAPVLMHAFCANGSGATNSFPNAGTGFTSISNFWNNSGTSESARFTNTSTRAATFTATATSQHTSMMCMFDEGASAMITQVIPSRMIFILP